MVISVLAISSCVAIALVSTPAVLSILVVAAPLATFAHLDLRLAQGIPSVSLVRATASFLALLILLQINAGSRAWPRLRPLDLALLAATVGIALSVTRSIELVRSAQVFFDAYLIPFMMYFLARNLIRDRVWLTAITVALVIVGLYLAILTTHQQLTGVGLLVPAGELADRYSQNLGRSTVVFGNSAISGALLAMIFPITLVLLLDSSGPVRKILLAASLVIIGVGLFYTYTRAAWVASFVSLMVLQYFYPRLRRISIPILILAGIAAVLTWNQLSSSTLFIERITSQGPIQGRSSLLELGFGFFRENPVWGIGFDNFRQITRLWNMTDIENTHNSFMFILVSAGLVGLLPYFTAFLLMLKEIIRGIRLLSSVGRKHLMATLTAAFVAYLANALVIDMVSAPYVSMVFFIVVGAHLGYMDRASSREAAFEKEPIWERASPLRASA